MTLELRSGTSADVDAAGRICHEAFERIAQQHGFAPNFASREVATGLLRGLFSRPEVHALVADINGRVAGTNFLWEGDPVAGIGPISVDPELQNNAIGRRLMHGALQRARLKGFKSVRLVQAAYHARSLSLYTKLGFVAREPLAVLQGSALATRIDAHDVRPAREADLASANALCRRVHGHARALELRHALGEASATVVEREGRITGYATDIGFFGHAVGETTHDLIALIAAARAYSGPGFLLPMRNDALFRWCLERGLRVVQPMTLMTLGEYREPQGAFLPSILY
jgi:predicted N-acetyltransferase YhbS